VKQKQLVVIASHTERLTVEVPLSSKKGVLDPKWEEVLRTCLLVEDPDMEEVISYGSGSPFKTSCLRLTMLEAHIAKVVRTAPIPQEKSREEIEGSADRSRRTCK
jgi:hypothetical protein